MNATMPAVDRARRKPRRQPADDRDGRDSFRGARRRLTSVRGRDSHGHNSAGNNSQTCTGSASREQRGRPRRALAKPVETRTAAAEFRRAPVRPRRNAESPGAASTGIPFGELDQPCARARVRGSRPQCAVEVGHDHLDGHRRHIVSTLARSREGWKRWRGKKTRSRVEGLFTRDEEIRIHRGRAPNGSYCFPKDWVRPIRIRRSGPPKRCVVEARTDRAYRIRLYDAASVHAAPSLVPVPWIAAVEWRPRRWSVPAGAMA